MKNGLPRILVIRLSAIGDVVRVLPALHALRDAYPHAQIDWAVERKAADLLEAHLALDDLLVFERIEGWAGVKCFAAFCRRIRGRRYDIVVDFHGILKSGLIAGASGAKDRYGFARPRSQEGSYLFTNKKVRLFSHDLNRIEENLQLVDALGAKRASLDVTIAIPPDVQEEVDAYFDATFDGGKWTVAMHPAMDRAEKRWPVEHFAELADLLLADGRFEVMLTWGPGQFDVIHAILDRVHRNVVVAPETQDLRQYAWLVHRAHLYFGGDTGPMHIASAMGTPVVAVFGGTDPAKHAPLRNPFEVLHIPPEGDTSDRARKATAEERLRRITPEMAYDSCVRLLTQSAARPSAQ